MSGQKTNTGSGIFDWQFERPDMRYGYNADTQWGGFSRDAELRSRPAPEWALLPFEKYGGNPVFAPDKESWDCGRYGGGVHNGALVKRGGEIYYIYRGEFRTPDDDRLAAQRATGINYHCDIGTAVLRRKTIADGEKMYFERVAGPFFRHGEDFIYSFEDVCCVDAGESVSHPRYCIYLNRWDWARMNDPSVSGIICCTSDDLIHWENHGLLFPDAGRIHRNPCVLQDADNRPVKDMSGRYVMYINNGLIAFSHDLMHWESEETGYDWPGGEGCFALSRGEDIILFTGGNHSGHFYAVGEVLFSRENPKKPLDYLQNPVLTSDPAIPWEDGRLADPPHDYCSEFSDTIFFTGMTRSGDRLYVSYGGSEYYTCLATIKYNEKEKEK